MTDAVITIYLTDQSKGEIYEAHKSMSLMQVKGMSNLLLGGVLKEIVNNLYDEIEKKIKGDENETA